MLNWVEASTSQPLHSPVVLVPLELSRKSPRDNYSIRVPAVEEEVLLNPALVLKMKYDYGLELPELPDFEKESISGYLKWVNKNLVNSLSLFL